MAEEGVLNKFCGSPFWDANLTWNTDTPQFTPCFERTVLVWIPCGFLWLFAPLETHYVLQSADRFIPWSWLNVSKLVVSAALMTLQCLDFFYAVHKSVAGEDVFGVDFLAPAIIFFSVLLQLIFIIMEKRRGIQSSGYLFLFWLLLLIFGIPEYCTYFMNVSNEEVDTDNFTFATYMVYFPLVIIMLLLNSFADATPKYVNFPRGEKPCPETEASFLSRITFSWLDKLIWRGYRQPLEQSQLWDLSYENTSSKIVRKWDKNWRKTTAKAYKKGESHTSAKYTNASAHVEISGTAGNKEHYLSILPTIVRTFGPTFFFGGILKLFHDILQFISPQILSALISYIESDEGGESEPVWRGYFYACLMLICAQVQSFLLAQYFMKMFIVGLRIRTGVISAVYRKALKISSSARKESTVGEIVNLMSVDAQRFMDLTTYVNMLWSAPMQIALALYFLWDLLGPSVLSGLAVMIILIPVNGFMANRTKQLQIKQMKNKDQRVKLMNEILNGIKVLKLYAWEPSFEDQVLAVRGKEIKILKQTAYLTAGTSFIWSCTPFLVSLATFATFVNLSPDNILDAKKAFVSLTLFNLLRFPLSMLPMLISSLVQASVSLKRMNKFMNADELDPNCVTTENTESFPVVMENGTFAWGHDEEDGQLVLKGINLRVTEGSLVAVVGTVGAGKSSLLSAILGEMEKHSGRINVKGQIAYASQQAWIQNATLEANITFGQSHEPNWYASCIQACALQPDLDILPGGDQTEIGEKGINLSGGQKQRVSLARAVYADADIYLLDDPLSAVDSHVGKHIFENVIGPQGLLKKKTRILVTHGLTYLPMVDNIIVLKNGVVTEQGTYKQLMERKGEFQEFLLQYLSEAEDEEDTLEGLEDIKHQLESSLGREVVERQIRHKRESESESISEHELNKDNRTSIVRRRGSKKISESETGKLASDTVVAKEKKIGEKLIETEKAETGKVQMSVYKYYITAIGIIPALFTILSYTASNGCMVGSSIWLSRWAEEPLEADGTLNTQRRDMYLGVYGALGIGQAFAILFGAFSLSFGALDASAKLHADILCGVMHLPMQFFDTNPIGRLVNRFGKDVDTLDSVLPWTLRSWLMCFFTVYLLLYQRSFIFED
ncbi:multidrug resistance-associated protein 1 isoform X3 [Penaeus vannamei]|uniref:multidrug resistance-associated protein 1 isoform X3 n=1 Tax=Penaeus vannamei TaxID=6689 RepID=UPI00387F5160